MAILQHGEVVVALADAQGDGFTGEPFLLLGPLELLAFPFGRGQIARDLALDIDTSGRPRPKGSNWSWIRSTSISWARL